jgi:hypothetical protein
MTVSYSIDNGKTWHRDFTGDVWPTDVGLHQVRLSFPSSTRAYRVLIKIEGTDSIVWGLRSMVLKATGIPQEKARDV